MSTSSRGYSTAPCTSLAGPCPGAPGGPPPYSRRGFTLVELLVVIAIIGMLAALLMPAINSARERARQTTCMNNQRNFGQAIQQYVSSKDYFPGYRELLADQNQQYMLISWQVALMSDLRTDTYQALKANGASMTMPYWELSICPSDYSGTGKTSPWTSYVVNTGAIDQDSSHSYKNGTAIYFDKPANGIFLDRARLSGSSNGNLNSKPKLSLSDIKDGQSTTLMLSENVDAYYYVDVPIISPSGSITANDIDSAITSANTGNCTERGSGFLWWDTSGGGGGINPPGASPPNGHPEAAINGSKLVDGDMATNSWPNNYYWQNSVDKTMYQARPASNHPGGVVVTFADASNKFLREDIDYDVYQLLMTSDGANACSAASLYGKVPNNWNQATTTNNDGKTPPHSWQKYVPLDEGKL